LTYTITDTNEKSRSFSHKLAFTEYVAPAFLTEPDATFTIKDGMAWSYTYPESSVGTQTYMVAW